MTATTAQYADILEKISRLSRQQKTDLLAELESQVQADSRKGGRSILELRGLGKEIWEGVDAQEYVNAERDSWDG